jgi:NitT/TauT family transport system permease protein
MMRKNRVAPSFSHGENRFLRWLRIPLVGKTAAVILALLVWQGLAMWLADDLILVSPIKVFLRLGTIWQEAGFFARIGFSLWRIACGFFLAFIAGVLLAVLAGRFPLIETLLFPYMAVVKAVPVVSFIVIAYVWMSSRTVVMFISFLIVLPTVYTGMLSGIKARDRKMDEMADVFGISPLRRFLFVRLPALSPYILSSVSLGAGLAFKSGIAAEIIAVPAESMGEAMYYASLWLQNVDLFTWTVVLLIMSVLFEKMLSLLLKLGFRRLWRV